MYRISATAFSVWMRHLCCLILVLFAGQGSPVMMSTPTVLSKVMASGVELKNDNDN